MPTITNMDYNPVPALLEHPLSIDVSLRVSSAGPVTVRITLEETLPYFFIRGGKHVKELLFTRTFGSAGDHTTRFTVALIGPAHPSETPSVTVMAAGIDGSSIPFTLALGID